MYYKSKIEETNYREIIGKTIPVDIIISYLERAGGQLKTSLHQIPDRLASRLVHESDEATIHELIMSEIEEVYRQLASLLDKDQVVDQITKKKRASAKSGKIYR